MLVCDIEQLLSTTKSSTNTILRCGLAGKTVVHVCTIWPCVTSRQFFFGLTRALQTIRIASHIGDRPAEESLLIEAAYP